MKALHVLQRRRLEIRRGVLSSLIAVIRRLRKSLQHRKTEDAYRTVRRVDGARRERETGVVLDLAGRVVAVRNVIDVVVVEHGRLAGERRVQRRADGADVTDDGHDRIVLELLAAIAAER